MKKIKIGVIGMGLMGTLHARVYRSMREVELVGVVENDHSKKNMLEQSFHVPVYETADKLWSSCDAVSICTPDHDHQSFILEAFSNNVRVLVEKPLEISKAACDTIIEKRPDPSYLMVGHILRFDPRVQAAKQAIEQGDLGRLLSIKINRSNSIAAAQKIGKRTSVTWFLGIHDVDLILWLTGASIKRLQAYGKKIYTPYWDYVVSILELSNDVLCSMEHGWIFSAVRASGCDASLSIIGDQGMIEVDLTHNDVTLSTQKLNRSMRLDTYHWPMIDDIPYGDLRIELSSFVESVIHGCAPPVTAEQAAQAVEAVERIEKQLDQTTP